MDDHTPMARAIWKGSIAFGLVNIPVSLTAAESRPDIQLHMVDSKNHARIRYERVNADTGEEVPWDRLVKGYEHEEGQFILLSEDDMEAVWPELTKTIEITEFVALDEIDPILFDKPYYLEPEKRGFKAYSLLREAMRSTGMAGISRVVIRTQAWDAMREFTKAVAREVAAFNPSRLVITSSKDKRKGRIFIDWMRNGEGSTCIAPWSLRARDGVSVSMPVNWSDLGNTTAAGFTIHQPLAPPAEWADPEPQLIPKALLRRIMGKK